MKKQNVVYSERQIDLLIEIGKKYRPRIIKDMRIQTYPLIISYFLVIGFSILLALGNPIYYVMLMVVVVFGSVGLVGLALLTRREYINLLKSTDLEVGVFYKRKEPKVIGNAKFKRQSFVLPFIFVGILSLIVTVMMIFFICLEKPDYTQLSYETKEIESISKYRDSIVFIFAGETKEYFINSIYADYIDEDSIFENITGGKNVVIGYEEIVDDQNISIIYLYSDDVFYMNESEFNQGYDRNHNSAVAALIVSSIFALSSFIVVLYFGKIAYNKRIKLEVVNLELTKEEITQFNKLNIEDMNNAKTIFIESKVSDLKSKIVSFIAAILFVVDIGTIITTQQESKIYAGIVLTVPAICFILWAISCYISRDILSSEKFIKKRLFFVKEYSIRDIMQIKYTYSKDIYGIMIYDDKNNEIANFVPLEKSCYQLLEGFEQLGILVQKYE